MANTYRLISTVTVGSSGASSIDFNSIPNTYTDLLIVGSLRTNAAYQWASFSPNFNGSTSSFSQTRLLGYNGASIQSDTLSGGVAVANGSTGTASTFSNFQIYIPNYTSSQNKSFSVDGVVENNGSTQFHILGAFLWSNSAAITSISLPTSDTIQQYSSATLYGIKNS